MSRTWRRLMPATSMLGLATALLALPATANAQSTVIIPDSAPALTTNTVVLPQRPEPGDTTVLIVGGQYRGPASNPNQNLFHSFERFDLGLNTYAVWQGNDATRLDVRYIVNRVTGGDPSDIHGRIDSTYFPNADFYFINPAGIVFDGNSSVHVPRAFYASTAGALNFTDGTRLQAATADGSTLSTAAPASFGFIAGQSGDIAIRQTTTGNLGQGINADPGSAIHLSARNLLFENSRFFAGPALVRIAAVGDATVSLGLDPRVALPALGGRIVFRGASLQVGSSLDSTDLRGAEAALAMSAGEIVLEGLPTGAANVPGAIQTGIVSSNGDMEIGADRILISGYAGLFINSRKPEPFQLTLRIGSLLRISGDPNAPFLTQLGGSAFGPGAATPNLAIIGPSATFDISSAVVNARSEAPGGGGDIVVDVDRLIAANAVFSSSTNFPLIDAAGGTIRLRANTMSLTDTSVETYTTSPGQAGDIVIAAGSFDMLRGRLFGGTGSAGQGGTISLQADRARLTDAEVFTGAGATGSAGGIRFDVGDLALLRSRLSSGTGSSGNAGTVEINSDLFALTSSTVESATSGAGNAGSISINAARWDASGSLVSVGTSGSGAGGNIMIRTGSATLGAGTAIVSATSGSGRGGNIDIRASDSLALTSSTVTSRSDAGAGPAGSILLGGRTISLVAASLQATTQSASNAGNIVVQATGALAIDGSRIDNSSLGDGNSGRIDLSGASVGLANTIVESGSSVRGASGAITIAALAGSLEARNSMIRTNATGPTPLSGADRTGGAGSISLRASDDILLLSSAITSTASGRAASAGSIDIAASDRVAIGILPSAGTPALISIATDSEAPPAPGQSAEIRIEAGMVDIRGVTERIARDQSLAGRVTITSATTGSQDAGAIDIIARNQLSITRADLASLTTNLPGQATTTGHAGNIGLHGQDILLSNAVVEATSGRSPGAATGSAGDAGSILMAAARDLSIVDRSAISSASTGFGRAGSVELRIGRNGLIAGLSRVDTDINGDASAGGDVRIIGPEASLIVTGLDPANPGQNRSAISSSTGNGQRGGTITINVDRLELRDGGGLFAVSTSGASGDGGDVAVIANTIIADGPLSGIQATALGSGSAGSISLAANRIRLSDGAEVSTNALSTRAGSISILMPPSGLLELYGRDNPVSITTSSGPGTGGRIVIASPLAIVSNGGNILALGQARGANVEIDSRYFIRSLDRVNQLAVDGNLVLDSDIGDVSQGTEELETPPVDAFEILISQCAGTRSDGQVSQLGLLARGPYSRLSSNDAHDPNSGRVGTRGETRTCR